MLTTEWNLDDAKEVWQEEAREDGIVIGEERGVMQTAKNMLAKGYSDDEIIGITNLSQEQITALR